MAEPSVRPFAPQDAPDVQELDVVARREAGVVRGGSAWLAEHPSIELLADGISVLVATIAGTVVGFLASRDDDVAGRGRVCSIDRIYVLEQARGIGCGDLLIGAALQAARARQCTVIEGEALPGDRETKNLYERAGITARKIVLARDLNGPSTPEIASR